MTEDDIVEKLLRNHRTIARVCLSSRPWRDSYVVGKYLQHNGYRLDPVNSNETAILGEKNYPSLVSVPESGLLVDVFRRPERVGEVVNEATISKARAIWMQVGVINHEAYRRARTAGLDVVMNKCMMLEHKRLKTEGSL